MASPTPPPTLPEPVQWVFVAVAGDRWPETNEAALNQLADKWGSLAEALSEAHPELANRLGEVTTSYGGTAGLELQLTSYDLLGIGGDGGLLQLAEAALAQHMTTKMGALDIELAKYTIAMEVLVTAISVMYAIISAYISLGATTISIPGLIQAGRTGVARIIRELVSSLASRQARRYALRRARQAGARAAITRYLPHRVAEDGFRRLSLRGLREMTREGLQEVVEEVFIAGGAQAMQMWWGSREPGDWNVDMLRTAAIAGFVGGFSGTAIFGSDFFGLGNRFMSRWLREGGLRRLGIRALQGAAQNPPTSAFGGWVASGFDGGLAGLGRMFQDGFLGAAMVGGTRAGLTLAGGRFGTRISPVQVDPVTGLALPRPGGPFDPTLHPEAAVTLQQLANSSITTALMPGSYGAEPAGGAGGGDHGGGAPPAAAQPEPEDPSGSGRPAVDQAVEEVRASAGHAPEVRAAVDEKVAAVRQLAAADRDAYDFLLAAGFTPEEARPVIAGVPDSLDAARTRLQEQDATIAELIDEDPELAQTMVDAGATGELANRLDELATARASAAARNAAANEQLVAVGDQLSPAAGPRLAQLQAAFADQVRAEVVAARIARAGEPSPVAEEFGRRVAEATAGRDRPAPQPLDEAVAYDLRNTLLAAGASPETAGTLAQQLAELRATGIYVTTIDAFLADQAVHVDFAELATALELAWDPTLVAPEAPAPSAEPPALPPGPPGPLGLPPGSGDTFDDVARGLVEFVNRALEHRTLTLLGRRGSVSLKEAPSGEGSGRRLSLWVSPGYHPRKRELVVTAQLQGDPEIRVDGDTVVVALAPGVDKASAQAYIARAAAMTIDEVRARQRWHRVREDTSYDRDGGLPARGILRPGALPESFLRKPRARKLTALDVVNLELELLQPLRELETLERSDSRWQETFDTVQDGTRKLGLTMDRSAGAPELTGLQKRLGEAVTATGEAAPATLDAAAGQVIDQLRQRAGLVPERAASQFQDYLRLIADEARLGHELRTLLTTYGFSWKQAQELVEWAETASPRDRTEASGLPQLQTAELLDALADNRTEQERVARDLRLHGMVGETLQLTGIATRYQVRADAAAAAMPHDSTAMDLFADAQAEAARFVGALPGSLAGIAAQVENTRWGYAERWIVGGWSVGLRGRINRWADQLFHTEPFDLDVLGTEPGWRLASAAAGRPLETLGVLKPRSHMGRRIAFAIVEGGFATWALGAAVGMPLAVVPIVAGFAGHTRATALRAQAIFQSSPRIVESIPRRLIPGLVAHAASAGPNARWGGKSVAVELVSPIPAPVREGLRGVGDAYGLGNWARARAEADVTEMYQGRLPGTRPDRVTGRVDAAVAAMRGILTAVRHAMFLDGRTEPTDPEQELLSDIQAELGRVAGDLDQAAQAQARAYHRNGDRPAKAPAKRRLTIRRVAVEGPVVMVRALVATLRGEPQIGWDQLTDFAAGRFLATGEDVHAARTLLEESGAKAATLAYEVQDLQHEVMRVRDGVPERPAGRRPLLRRTGSEYWPRYGKRYGRLRHPTPVYAAQRLRGYAAAAGMVSAYGALWALGTVGSLPSLLRPTMPGSVMRIGMARGVLFSGVTTYLDWNYRQWRDHASRNLASAMVYRGLLDRDQPIEPVPALARRRDELKQLRQGTEEWADELQQTAPPHDPARTRARRTRAALVATALALSTVRGAAPPTRSVPAPEPREPTPEQVDPAPPAPPTPPAPNAPPVYRVAPGDSMWHLAERFLGDAERWPEIAALNPGITDPDLIHPGDELTLPEDAVDRAAFQHATGELVERPASVRGHPAGATIDATDPATPASEGPASPEPDHHRPGDQPVPPLATAPLPGGRRRAFRPIEPDDPDDQGRAGSAGVAEPGALDRHEEGEQWLRELAGRPPEEVAEAWRRLTDDQRAQAMARHREAIARHRAHDPTAPYPNLLGTLDGLPSAVRGEANREVLAAERERVTELAAAYTEQPERADAAAAAAGIRDGLAALDRWLDEDRDRLLLGLDVTAGYVTAATSDPDTAANVSVWVPGGAASLGAIGEDEVDIHLGRIGAIEGAALRADPDHRTAVVLGLGYRTPPPELASVRYLLTHPRQLPTVARDYRGYVEGAVGWLRGLVETLRVTTGGEAWLTVAGHSLGASVVAAAAMRVGLPAHALVFLGAPGVFGPVTEMTVDGDSELVIFEATAENDPVRWVPPAPGRGLGPAAAAAGARSLPTDPRGHEGYLDEGNPALPAFGQIVTRTHPWLPAPAGGEPALEPDNRTAPVEAAVTGEAAEWFAVADLLQDRLPAHAGVADVSAFPVSGALVVEVRGPDGSTVVIFQVDVRAGVSGVDSSRSLLARTVNIVVPAGLAVGQTYDAIADEIAGFLHGGGWERWEQGISGSLADVLPGRQPEVAELARQLAVRLPAGEVIARPEQHTVYVKLEPPDSPRTLVAVHLPTWPTALRTHLDPGGHEMWPEAELVADVEAPRSLPPETVAEEVVALLDQAGDRSLPVVALAYHARTGIASAEPVASRRLLVTFHDGARALAVDELDRPRPLTLTTLDRAEADELARLLDPDPYMHLLEMLRGPDPPAEVLARAGRISQLLMKLPPVAGTTYRGLEFDAGQLAGYQPGRVVSDPAFASTTQDLTGASIVGRGMPEKFTQNVLLTITGHSGRDVSTLVGPLILAEVVYDRGTSFLVTSRTWDDEQGQWRITLEEAQP